MIQKRTLGSRTTAEILIGYQNDYFPVDGILRADIEESAKAVAVAVAGAVTSICIDSTAREAFERGHEKKRTSSSDSI